MASLAFAYPQAAPAANADFTLVAFNSSVPEIHLRPINANGLGFWIGKDTASSCDNLAVDCSPYPGNTTVVGAGQGAQAYLIAYKPQQVYVTSDGGLAFQDANTTTFEKNSVFAPFTYTAPATAGSIGSLTVPGDVYACPDVESPAGVYRIGVDHHVGLYFGECTPITIGAITADPSTYQYN